MTQFEKSLERKPKRIADKARAIATRANAGAAPRDLKARRMKHTKHGSPVYSVSIGRAWRVLLDEKDGKLIPRELVSHENYSRGCKPGAR